MDNRWILVRDIRPENNQDQRDTYIPTRLNSVNHTTPYKSVFLKEEVVLKLREESDEDGDEHCPEWHVHEFQEFMPRNKEKPTDAKGNR